MKTYGNLVHEEILDAATDASGNIISVGYFSGSTTVGSVNLSSNGNSDILIMKTDDQGAVLWAVKAGGIGPDRAYSVAVDNNGNSYITGYIYDDVTFGSFNVSAADRDAYAAKIDPNGNFLWVQNFGGQFGDTGYGIEVDQVGNVIVTGQYKGNGVFGADNFTSTTDPNTGVAAYDFFVTKLNGGGNFLWTREANAKYDDRGLAVTIDEQNNIYVAGQFSDTITFQNTYNNQAMNAGFVIKYDDLGNEVWLDKYRAAQVILYDIKWHDDNLYLTGDFKGNMQVAHQSGTTNFSAGGEYNILVSKLTEAGNLSWFSSNFSENEVSSKQLAVDSNNDIYLTGLFKCDFTQMNQLYGNSTFLSLGYRDVHYVKYSNAGLFQWARQFGSNEDDYCSAIVMNAVDHPVLAGSFESWMVVPTGDSFDYSNCTGELAFTLGNCSDIYNGTFCRRKAAGNKDIFITDPFDVLRLPLDYYVHYTPCDFDTLAPQILDGADTLELCHFGGIYYNLFHIAGSNDTTIHPKYDFLWNTGVTTANHTITTTGLYTIEATRQDGCAAYNDTIFVLVHPNPAKPLLSDNWGYYLNVPFEAYIDTCDTDSLKIHVIPGDTLTQTLTWDGGIYLNDSTRYINSSGAYTATAVSEFGCERKNIFHVALDDFAIHDTLDPQIHFSDSIMENTDTLYICQNDYVLTWILDHNFIDMIAGGFPYKTSYWYLDSVLLDSIVYVTNEQLILADMSNGWHNLLVHLVNECGDSVDYFIERDFYVVNVPNPFVNIIEPVIFGNYCPGDTVPIFAQSSDTLVGWQPGAQLLNTAVPFEIILGFETQQILVSVDTITPQITCNHGDMYYLPAYPHPEIIISDYASNGGIVCPNDSLELEALSGQNWIWIGPQGDTLGTNQNVWVSLPGFYHCIITDDFGCVLGSNFLEAKEYGSPFLQVEPQLICEGQTSEITVIANQFTSITWLPPLGGSAPSVTVDSAGVYYCETNFCNITLLDSVIILLSVPQAQITAVPDGPICPGDTVTLFANGGMMNYWWNGDHEGQSILETTLTGSYILTTENEIGCQTTDTLVVSYLSNPVPPNVGDTTICAGDSVTLFANSNDTTYWYNASSNLLGIGDSLVLPNVITSLNLIVKNKDSACFSFQDAALISIHASSVTPILITDSVYCENDLIQLQTANSTGLFLYTWIFPDNTSSANPTIVLGNATTGMNGTYSVFYSDANCTSDTVDLNLFVNPLPLVDLFTLSNLQICAGDSVVLDANTNASSILWSNGVLNDTSIIVFDPGVYFYSATLNGCSLNSDSVAVTETALSASGGSIDTSICTNNFVVLQSNSAATVIWFDENMDTIFTGTDYTSPILNSDTNYYFQITEPGLCPVVEHAAITVIQNDYVPGIMTPSLICQNDSVFISSGDVGVTDFSWFNTTGELSDSSQLWIPTNLAGTLNYGLVLSFGSCASDTAFFEVTVSPLPTNGILAMSSASICQGDSVMILAQTNADHVTWIPSGEADTLIAGLYEDIYYYFAELNGCYSVSDSIQITYNPTTQFNPISDTIICEGEIASFDLNTSNSVIWADEFSDTLSVTPTYTTGALYDDAQLFYQVTESGLCPSPWMAVFVDVIETDFTPDYSGMSDLCLGDSVLISADDLTAQNYFWILNGDTISTLPFVALLPDNSGNVNVQLVTGSYGCFSDTSFVSINMNDLPVFELPNDTILCINEELIFNTSYDYLIDWYIADSIGFIEDTFAIVTFTNNAGCALTDTILVSYMDCSLFMPNVFTPDGDGINDVIVFSIEKGEVLNVIIQNRWGVTLHEGTAGEWDGLDKTGSESVTGTYFYIIEYRHIDGSVGKEQGWFFLQR